MTKKLVWRLGKLPSPDEVRELVKDKIITKDEAREILFSQDTETDRDTKSLENEVKFLRALVEKLSQNQRSTIIETIREVQVPYQQYEWYKPYQIYCGENTVVGGANTQTANAANFTDINTF